jgi:hypothetical protein
MRRVGFFMSAIFAQLNKGLVGPGIARPRQLNRHKHTLR